MRSPHRTPRRLNRLPVRRLARRLATRSAARTAALVALSATLATPAVASAATTGPDDRRPVITGVATDPDDVNGPLDIQRVRDRVVQVDRTHYLVSYRVRSYTPFANATLDGTSRNFDLELDRDGEAGSERTVMVLDDAGVLTAQIISTATRQVLATVSASRPNDRALEITGPRRLLGAHSYFWASNYHADGSALCGTQDGVPITCQDSVPDDGWLRLDRPAWPDTDDRQAEWSRTGSEARLERIALLLESRGLYI
ncbi:MAG TPA: hypothetical protein VLK34_01115 [Nocardioidaceae bacterium]|nr:hypothetical protein [Nocardioidaceae bacterium]